MRDWICVQKIDAEDSIVFQRGDVVEVLVFMCPYITELGNDWLELHAGEIFTVVGCVRGPKFKTIDALTSHGSKMKFILWDTSVIAKHPGEYFRIIARW